MALFTESHTVYTAQHTECAVSGYFKIMLHLLSKSLHRHLRRTPERNTVLLLLNKTGSFALFLYYIYWMGCSASNIKNPFKSRVSNGAVNFFVREPPWTFLLVCLNARGSTVATNVEQNVTINRRELPTYENKKKSQKWAKTYWSLITRTKHHDSHFNIAL